MNKKSDRYQRMQKTAGIHLAMEAKQQINQLIDEFPYNPEGMYYFYESLTSYYDEKDTRLADKDVIATMCIYVPDELIYAAGAMPLRICNGAYAMDQIGAEYMPAKSCSVAKSSLGLIHLEKFPFGAKPKLIINPASCDQKKKLPELLTDQSIEIHTLDVPPSKESEASQVFWYQNINELAKKIENVTDNKITRKKLKYAIKLIAAAQKEYHRLHHIRAKAPVIWGKDVIALTNAYFYEDIQVWTQKLADLNNELEERVRNKQFIVQENAPRILLTGSPSIFPNLKIPLLIEQLGNIVVADEFCSSNRLLYDTVAVDEWRLYDMIPAIADRYLKPCTCPNLSPNEDRVRKLLETVKKFKVDGIVYQAFSGCQLYEMESFKIARILEENGIPMLYVETDYSPDDEGQLSTRVEAFSESIKAKKLQKASS